MTVTPPSLAILGNQIFIIILFYFIYLFQILSRKKKKKNVTEDGVDTDPQSARREKMGPYNPENLTLSRRLLTGQDASRGLWGWKGLPARRSQEGAFSSGEFMTGS